MKSPKPMSLCSADPLREAAESWKGSPQRHPVQSPSHDSRQEVSPEDIQVCGSAVLFVFLKIYVMQVLGEAFCGCGVDLQKITLSIFKPPHSKYTVNSVFTCVLQTVLCRHRAGGLAGAAERLCAHSFPCCRDVAGTTRRRGAKSW